jgi:hypothetical protein
MSTLGEQIKYEEKWNPESIDLTAVTAILKEVEARHDIQDATAAASLSTRLLIVADHLSGDMTKLKIYFTKTRCRAKDRFNDVKQSAIDEKSDAGKERVALCDVTFRGMRDEYKKAELLVTHLEIKYRELLAHHYDFRDAARRLSGLTLAGGGGSDSERREDFVAQIPLGEEKKKEEEPF